MMPPIGYRAMLNLAWALPLSLEAMAGHQQAAMPKTLSAAMPPMLALRSPDIGPFMDEVDANKDGCLSREGSIALAGVPECSYSVLKNRRGCLTSTCVSTPSAPGGIDVNGDRRLTLAQVEAFDNKMAPLTRASQVPPQT